MQYGLHGMLTWQPTHATKKHCQNTLIEDILAVLLLRLMPWSAVLAGIQAALTMPST